MNKYAGFTLIELVIVIVILGILAAVAIPQFTDFSIDAKNAAVRGVAGALSSANAVNYAARKENPTLANTISVANCTAISGLLSGATLPVNYSITSETVAVNATSVCTVTYSASSGPVTATFYATGI